VNLSAWCLAGIFELLNRVKFNPVNLRFSACGELIGMVSCRYFWTIKQHKIHFKAINLSHLPKMAEIKNKWIYNSGKFCNFHRKTGG